MLSNFIDLRGRRFVVTGAGSGLGRAIAVLCHGLGAKLVLIDRDSDGLELTSVKMERESYVNLAVDLTDFKQLNDTLQGILTDFGPIDGMCHCAGIEYTLPLKSMTPRHHEDLFRINTIAGFEIARILSRRGNFNTAGCSFVFIASILSMIGRMGVSGYASSKGALVSGSKSIALELASKRIRVNSLSPGTVMTEMMAKLFETLDEEQKLKRISDFPLGIGSPEDVANMVVFLFSDRSKWITGTNIIVDGGYTAR